MILTRTNFVLALCFCAAAHAATINTNLTVTATGSIFTSPGSLTATGTATLTGIGTGTFSGSVSLTGVSGQTVNAPFTITLSGGGGTITGTLTVPVALLTGGPNTPATGSATITGGTGPYAGATGSFPNLTGSYSGSLANSITLSFSGAGTIVTGGDGGGGGGGGGATPAITAVLDAGSYTRNIAQGSIFVVKGTNLSGSGFKQLGFPLPTTTDNVKITFTPAGGGAGTDAFLVYTYNQSGVNQLAGVLPSNLAAGTYNVTVTNGSATSQPFSVTVVQRKLGLITQDSTGSGLAVVQNYISATQLDVNRFTTGSISGTTISPAKPGQVLIAWATGMGPVSGGDNTASPGFNFAESGVNVQVIVGGMTITPVYAGRAPGLAGADQINFTLPANTPTGCTVPLEISVNGVRSNPTFLAIAPNAGSAACAAPGFTDVQLERFDRGGTFTVGYFGLSQITQTVPQVGTIKFNSASGTFIQYTGFQLASGSAQTAGITAPGSCQVNHITTSGQDSSPTGISYRTLDAGTVTLSGPAASSISNRAFRQLTVKDPTTGNDIISYGMELASEGLSIPGVPPATGTIVGGTYTLSGAGGRDVGAFSTSLNVGAPLTLTGGLPSTITRSAGLTLNWTGGNPSDLVQISGGSSTTTGTGANRVTDAWSFACYTTAGAGTFTVPASILTQLPPVSASSTTGGGNLQIVSTPNPTANNGLFTAPLTAGGTTDFGLFFALVGVGGSVSYQ
jgi:uncharacterized protein (TIGR03437 family)